MKIGHLGGDSALHQNLSSPMALRYPGYFYHTPERHMAVSPHQEAQNLLKQRHIPSAARRDSSRPTEKSESSSMLDVWDDVLSSSESIDAPLGCHSIVKPKTLEPETAPIPSATSKFATAESVESVRGATAPTEEEQVISEEEQVISEEVWQATGTEPYTAPSEIADEFVQSKGFCVRSCTCWPVWSGSILVFILYGCATLSAILLTASLFSKGVTSSSFRKGGGCWLLSAAATGVVLGSLVGGIVSGCVAGGLGLGAGMMALFSSLLLVGRRGAWLGAMGGLLTGAVIGILTNQGALAIGLGAAIGVLLGLVVGFAPIARHLKMNERYIRRGIAGPQGIRSMDGVSKNYSTRSQQIGGDMQPFLDSTTSMGSPDRGSPPPDFVLSPSQPQRADSQASVDERETGSAHATSPAPAARQKMVGVDP
ncbi:transmembrane domain-containing protein [Cyclospora cayetanensis]|uniref:Transmembrane domain-containing protein n=1 Tax=Cyclospora cayetanensis TaxID=88456 RepID=A0A1D3D4B5_9EIME|nr:transmembrane domain-containing protein [Cyclospora cayetanensis]